MDLTPTASSAAASGSGMRLLTTMRHHRTPQPPADSGSSESDSDSDSDCESDASSSSSQADSDMSSLDGFGDYARGLTPVAASGGGRRGDSLEDDVERSCSSDVGAAAASHPDQALP